MGRQNRVEQARALRFRLYPTVEQERVLYAQACDARVFWNLIHACHEWAGENRRVDWAVLDREVRAARKGIDWVSLPAQAAQQVLRTYRKAWDSYYRDRAKPAGVRANVGKPTFKGRKSRLAVDVPQARDLNVVRESGKFSSVAIPKVGRVRFRAHRTVPETAKVTGARLVRDPDGWYLVLRTVRDVPLPEPRGLEPLVGVDRGVAVPLALSDGNDQTHSPWLTPGEQTRLYRLERQAARQRHARWDRTGRKSRVGRNERDTYHQIAALRAKEARRRLDWQHRTSRTMADAYATVAFENLHIKPMTRSAAGTVANPGRNVKQKAGLNRVMLGEGHAQFRALLEYKLNARGGRIEVVPAPYTSQRCHACGTVTEGSRESQAGFKCQNARCGWVGNADFNAARNIETTARYQLGLAKHEPAVSEGTNSSPAPGTGDAARAEPTTCDSRNAGGDPLHEGRVKETGTNDRETAATATPSQQPAREASAFTRR